MTTAVAPDEVIAVALREGQARFRAGDALVVQQHRVPGRGARRREGREGAARRVPREARCFAPLRDEARRARRCAGGRAWARARSRELRLRAAEARRAGGEGLALRRGRDHGERGRSREVGSRARRRQAPRAEVARDLHDAARARGRLVARLRVRRQRVAAAERDAAHALGLDQRLPRVQHRHPSRPLGRRRAVEQRGGVRKVDRCTTSSSGLVQQSRRRRRRRAGDRGRVRGRRRARASSQICAPGRVRESRRRRRRLRSVPRRGPPRRREGEPRAARRAREDRARDDARARRHGRLTPPRHLQVDRPRGALLYRTPDGKVQELLVQPR